MKPSKQDCRMLLSKVERIVVPKVATSTKGQFTFKFSDHFHERLEERATWPDLEKFTMLVNRLVQNHICEMIYWAHLPNRPHRLEVKHGSMLIGLIYSDTFKRFICTTFHPNNQYAGNQDTFIITPKL